MNKTIFWSLLLFLCSCNSIRNITLSRCYDAYTYQNCKYVRYFINDSILIRYRFPGFPQSIKKGIIDTLMIQNGGKVWYYKFNGCFQVIFNQDSFLSYLEYNNNLHTPFKEGSKQFMFQGKTETGEVRIFEYTPYKVLTYSSATLYEFLEEIQGVSDSEDYIFFLPSFGEMKFYFFENPFSNTSKDSVTNYSQSDCMFKKIRLPKLL